MELRPLEPSFVVEVDDSRVAPVELSFEVEPMNAPNPGVLGDPESFDWIMSVSGYAPVGAVLVYGGPPHRRGRAALARALAASPVPMARGPRGGRGDSRAAPGRDRGAAGGVPRRGARSDSEHRTVGVMGRGIGPAGKRPAAALFECE